MTDLGWAEENSRMVLVVGSIAYPLVLMVAIMRVRNRSEETTDRPER